jgi:uncharacterized membrane protein
VNPVGPASSPSSARAPRAARRVHTFREMATKPLTTPPPQGLAPVLERNLQALVDRRRAEDARRGPQDRAADRITAFTGSMTFVWIHVVYFGGWILWNLPFSPLPRFDPSLVVLAMAASVEAIFLSTFVLISQNRMAAAADRRAELDLQISLLAEHEVTRLVRMVKAIGDRLGIEEASAPELRELQRDVAPEQVLDRIEEVKGAAPDRQGSGSPR